MPFAALEDGGQLYYETRGSGPPVFLVTGVHGHASFWPPAIIEPLAERFTVVVHDQRGVGRSSRSATGYSVAQMCRDLLRLYETLGCRRASLVGHSLGGAIAQTMALDFPDRVDRLVLSATWPGGDGYFTNLLQLRRDMLAGADWSFSARFAALMMKPSWWVRDHADELFGDALPASPDRETRATMIERLDAVIAFDRRQDLRRIAAPTLVIGARDDSWTPAYFSEELGRLVSRAELLLLPEGQHFFPQVFPERFAAALLEFLARSGEPGVEERSS